MFNVLLVLFCTTFSFSLQSMNENKMMIENKEHDKKSKKFNLFSLSKKATTEETSIRNFNNSIITPTNSFSESSNSQTEHQFVSAVEDNNGELVKNYLNNPYFNPNIHRYATALHTCVITKNFQLLPLLLKDPRIDTSIRDNNNKTAHDLLKQCKTTETHSGLRDHMHEWQIKLFARLTLDTTTNKTCSSLKRPYQAGQMTDKIIIDAISIIETKIKKTEANQTSNDRQLPSSACFPDYATVEFMTKKIWFILNEFDKEFIYDTKKYTFFNV
jgi:hypothetical protein